jgi:unsaturated rhamnogalacturonyl hydrolase
MINKSRIPFFICWILLLSQPYLKCQVIYSAAVLKKVKMATLAMQRKDWEQGVVAQAFLESGDTLTAVQMAKAAIIYAQPDGRLAVLGQSGLIDCAMLGEALYIASLYSNDANLLKAEKDLQNYILNTASRAGDGTLYHAGKQMWVDSYNCAIPYLAKKGLYDEAFRQYMGLISRLWDEKKKMFNHIWDDENQKWINKSPWGVGNGWAAMGITRFIRSLPKERQKERLHAIRILNELISSCISYMDSDGFFHNTIDNPDTFVECNLSSLMAYSIYTGVKAGYLNSEMKKYADRMRKALWARIDQTGYVAGGCAAPAFDRPGISPEGQAFFILMETEAY